METSGFCKDVSRWLRVKLGAERWLIGGLATAGQGVWDVPHWHEKSSQAFKA